MKNIHVLPTDKPSRLIQAPNDILILLIELAENNEYNLNKHIYITSDEGIKVGDWTLMFDDLGNLFLCDKPQQYLGIEKGHHLNKGLRKIILTTDQDLIKDGVQAIDDEFLEWFIKNPKSEEVEVDKEKATLGEVSGTTYIDYKYKIIIPKEEAKQEALEEVAKDKYGSSYGSVDSVNAFVEGAKWQQERMYSEEEVLIIITELKSFLSFGDEFNEIEWFEKIKNK